jgi:DnaJ-class molecular chaperone
MESYYDILSTAKIASPKQIKNAYNANTANQRWKKALLKRVYETLRDPDAGQTYDAKQELVEFLKPNTRATPSSRC